MALLEQVQSLLSGNGQKMIQKSGFSSYTLCEQVKCLLNKSYIPEMASVEKSLLSTESIEKARDTMELAYKSKLNLITTRLGHRPDDYKIHDNEAWIYSEEYGRTVWNIIKIVE